MVSLAELIDELNKYFDYLKKRIEDPGPLLNLFAAEVHQMILDNFENEGRWNGVSDNVSIFSGGSNKWAPHKESTIESYFHSKTQRPNNQILKRSGAMERSIEVYAIEEGDPGLIISTGMDYSAIHQYGGIIRQKVSPRQRKYFWRMYYNTGSLRWFFMALAKELTIEIPARPYITLTEEDVERLVDLAYDWLLE